MSTGCNHMIRLNRQTYRNRRTFALFTIDIHESFQNPHPLRHGRKAHAALRFLPVLEFPRIKTSSIIFHNEKDTIFYFFNFDTDMRCIGVLTDIVERLLYDPVYQMLGVCRTMTFTFEAKSARQIWFLTTSGRIERIILQNNKHHNKYIPFDRGFCFRSLASLDI